VPLGDRFFVKFAWSHPAALRLAREISVLAARAREPGSTPNRHPQLTSADGTGEDWHTAPRRLEVRQVEAMRQITFRRDGGRSLLTGKP
jgi:hypothetical protein